MITEVAKVIECDMCKKSEIVGESTASRYVDVTIEQYAMMPLIDKFHYDVCLACENVLRAYIGNYSRNAVGRGLNG